MSKTLTDIAQKLKSSKKKVQLIYAFNGSGKTRLSREFKNLVSPHDDAGEAHARKILYYNAFTEDLFHWDNGGRLDDGPKLNIQPNGFTYWVLKDQGLDGQVVDNFKRYSGSKIEPVFNIEDNSITFKIATTSYLVDSGVNQLVDNDGNPLVTVGNQKIKISKGEESDFIWSVFYTLLKQSC